VSEGRCCRGCGYRWNPNERAAVAAADADSWMSPGLPMRKPRHGTRIERAEADDPVVVETWF
jgi:hypothetical protein